MVIEGGEIEAVVVIAVIIGGAGGEELNVDRIVLENGRGGGIGVE